MAQTSTSPSSETTSTMEAESNPTLPEAVQQPAMYIYNLSRSQWANRLNLEWIYLDVAVKGESDFILLVNSVPEESTAIDYEELTQASHALQSWLEIRNSEELIDGLQDTRPVGKMISLTVADSLQNHISEHVGEKRLMLAGGNKKFYRDLSNLEIKSLVFSESEDKRFMLVDSRLGKDKEKYIQSFLNVEASLQKRINLDIHPQPLQRKIQCSSTGIIELSGVKKLKNCVKKLTRSLNILSNQLGTHIHDMRITMTADIRTQTFTPQDIAQTFQKRNEFRQLSKCIDSLYVKSKSTEPVRVIPPTGIPNNTFILIQPLVNGVSSPCNYDYNFDSRNIARSLFQIQVLLYYGPVNVHLPESFVPIINQWFDVYQSTNHSSTRLVLDNRKGVDLENHWLDKSLQTGVMCSELVRDLPGDQILRFLTIAHIFRQSKQGMNPKIPIPSLQDWPDFNLVPREDFSVSLRCSVGNGHKLGKNIEDLLNAALSQIQSDVIVSHSFFAAEPERMKEGNIILPQFAITPDASVLRIDEENGQKDFYLIDITVGSGKASTQKNKRKLEKYLPTNFGKSFISKTILILLSESPRSRGEISKPFDLQNGVEKILILNVSTIPPGEERILTSAKLVELLLEMMEKDVMVLEYMVMSDTSEITRVPFEE